MTAVQKIQPAASGRMGLANVRSGKIERPYAILLYAAEGIGKSTWAAGAPSPIYLGSEDGTAQLDVMRFPQPYTWADAQEAVRVLMHEKHEFKTFVVDTTDWLEPLCWAHVAGKLNKQSVEDIPYGKGYVLAAEEWRAFTRKLDALRSARRMHIVLLGHAQVKRFNNPEGEDYDRFNLKMHEKTAAILKEWADAVLFANYETFTRKDGSRAKGIASGARIVHTGRRAAFDAKNRFDLPDTLPLAWDAFEEAARAGAPAAASALEAAVRELLPRLPDDARGKATAYLEQHATDPRALAKLLDRCRALVGPGDEPKETNNAE